jgi:hypothetical protein
MENLSHYGDIIAIPFFGLLVYYFYSKAHRSAFENILLIFSIGGFVLDILYTIEFLNIPPPRFSKTPKREPVNILKDPAK